MFSHTVQRVKKSDYSNIYSPKYGTFTGSKIWYISDLVIVQVLHNIIPKLTVPCPIFVISKSNHLILQPIVIIDYFSIGTFIQSNNTVSDWSCTSSIFTLAQKPSLFGSKYNTKLSSIRWVFKDYVVNSKNRNKSLDTRTSTYP